MFKHLLAAALVVAPTAAFAAPAAGSLVDNFFVSGYGGYRFANTLDWDGSPYDLAAGPVFGATFGIDTTVPGLSFDLDLTQTNTYYTCCGPSDVLNSTTAIFDVQYTAWLNDTFGVYGALGLGGLYLNYDNADHGVAAAYQAKIGVTANVTDQVQAFAEYRYQSALGDVWVGSPTYPIEVNASSALAGLKLKFK